MDRGRLLLHLPDSGSDGLTVAERDAFLSPFSRVCRTAWTTSPESARDGASSSRPTLRPSWTGWSRRRYGRIAYTGGAVEWSGRRPMTARVPCHPRSGRGGHGMRTGWSLPSAPWHPLLAGAGLLTFWLVSLLAPAAALRLHTWPLSPEPYAQADLDEALALRTEGYEAQSVAAFDRALADWTNEAAFHAREERIRRLLCSYEEDGPEAEFVLGTLAAAMGPPAGTTAATAHRVPPAYTDAAAYTRSEDVFGDSYVVYEASASYTIRYQMPGREHAHRGGAGPI